MAHQTTWVSAFVLRSVDYRESDRVVTLFTDALGKATVLARGARASRKRFVGALEPYALLRANLQLGRGDMHTVSEAEVLRAAPGILGDLTKMYAAGAALELLRDSVAPAEPDPRAFELLDAFLLSLEAPEADPEMRLLVFKLSLLALLGFGPALTACGMCGKVPRAGQAALFDPRRGCVVCRACGGGALRLSAAAREGMGAVASHGFGGEEPRWSAADRALVRAALDALIAEHVHGDAPSVR